MDIVVKYPENGPLEWEEKIKRELETEYRDRSGFVTVYFAWNNTHFDFAMGFAENPPKEFFDPAALMGVRPEAIAHVRRVLDRIGVPLE